MCGSPKANGEETMRPKGDSYIEEGDPESSTEEISDKMTGTRGNGRAYRLIAHKFPTVFFCGFCLLDRHFE